MGNSRPASPRGAKPVASCWPSATVAVRTTSEGRGYGLALLRRPWPRMRRRAVKRRQADIRRDGESVLIVKGKLISGPWRCDSCNAELHKGCTAYLYAAYPRHITEAMDEYGFEMERDYFTLTGEDRIALYGTAWPGGTLAQMLGRSRVTAGLPPKPPGAVGDRAVHAEAIRPGTGIGHRRHRRRRTTRSRKMHPMLRRASTAPAAHCRELPAMVRMRCTSIRWAATPSGPTTIPGSLTCSTSCARSRACRRRATKLLAAGGCAAA